MSRAKLHGVKQTKKLSNLPNDFENTFSKDWIDGMDFSLHLLSKNINSEAQKEDVKYFLLATSHFGEEIHGEIDHYIT